MENSYLKMVLVLRGTHLLHNNPHQLKVQAHHQIVQLHSLAQPLQAQIIVRLPILTIIRNNQIQPLINKIRILNQHNHNIYHPDFSG